METRDDHLAFVIDGKLVWVSRVKLLPLVSASLQYKREEQAQGDHVSRSMARASLLQAAMAL